MASPGLILLEDGTSGLLLEDSSGLLILEADFSAPFTVDAVLFKSASATFTADAVKRTPNTGSFSIEAVMVVVVTLRPGSDVVSSLETRSSGATNWNLIDEAGSPDSADWVDCKTIGAYFICQAVNPNIPANAIIKKILFLWYGTNSAPAQIGQIQERNPSSGTRYDVTSITQNVPGGTSGATRTTRSWDNQPYTAYDVNQLQFGAKTHATSGPVNLRTTQQYTVVTYSMPYTFTLDALLKLNATGSFTLDASIYTTPYFSVDAVILGTRSGSFSMDAVIKRNITGSFTADAITRRAVSGSFTADATLRLIVNPEVHETFPTEYGSGWGDAWEVPDGNSPGSVLFVDAAYLGNARNGISNDPEREWKYLGRQKRDREVRMVVGARQGLFITNDRQYISIRLRHDDQWSWTEATTDYQNQDYYSFDVCFQRVNATNDFSSTEAPITVRVRRRYNIEVLAKTDTGLTYKPLYISDSYRYNVVARVTGASPTRVQFKMWKVGDPEPTTWLADFEDSTGPQVAGWFGMAVDAMASADAIFSISEIESDLLDYAFTIDSVLAGGGSFSIDAVLKIAEYSVLADAVLLKEQGGTFTADSVLLREGTQSFVADAVTKREGTGSFALDALLSQEQSGSFSTDAQVDAHVLVSFTADGILFAQQNSSLTVDSIVRKGATGSFASSSVLRSQRTSSFGIEAVVLAPATSQLVASAVLLGTSTSSFTADAIRRVQRDGTLAADAILFGTVEAQAPADAVLFKTQDGSFTADAIFRVTRSASLTADAVRFQTAEAALSIDAVLLKTQEASFILDAVRGLAFLPDISAEFVIPTLDAVTAFVGIDFTSTSALIEATLEVTYLESVTEMQMTEATLDY